MRFFIRSPKWWLNPVVIFKELLIKATKNMVQCYNSKIFNCLIFLTFSTKQFRYQRKSLIFYSQQTLFLWFGKIIQHSPITDNCNHKAFPSLKKRRQAVKKKIVQFKKCKFFTMFASQILFLIYFSDFHLIIIRMYQRYFWLFYI